MTVDCDINVHVVIDPKTFQILPKTTHINSLAGQTVAIRTHDVKK